MTSMVCPRCSRVVDIHVVITMSGKCPMCREDIRAEVEIWYPHVANQPDATQEGNPC